MATPGLHTNAGLRLRQTKLGSRRGKLVRFAGDRNPQPPLEHVQDLLLRMMMFRQPDARF